MTQSVETVITNLRQNHFAVFYCERSAEVGEMIAPMIKPGDRVGVAGSVTLQEIGLTKLLQDKAAIILDHNKPGLTADEELAIRRQELVSDIFFTGVNAITESGQLFNVDGAGNRVAAMTFGPGKVVVVAGTNKIVPDISAAYERVQRIAAPLNNARLGTSNPCTLSGKCMNCTGQSRICNVVSIMERKPKLTDLTIILVNEKLGY